APLKENLAAGLLALSGWTPSTPLNDLFCGSGTIIIEAASIAAGRAPGLTRDFAFERLKGFDSRGWRRLKDAARSAITDTAAAHLAGSDISTRVIDQAIANAKLAGLQAWLDDGRLQFNAVDARVASPAVESGMIVTNPPYGERSAPRSASVANMMRDVGDRLKQQFSGWDAWVLTSDRQLPKQLRLQETRKAVLFNGPIECRFFRFELVTGGYRPRPSKKNN
ncbi:MAG TPA: class I SAM-dependent RNA methyltransferase, partial [Burkholderiaceae bacterium]|nr:class I SAM-dependent RNA methyltransferase [Burkholderiaceae bacterium]